MARDSVLTRAVKWALLLALLASGSVLAGCGSSALRVLGAVSPMGAPAATPPIVQATDAGSASLTVIGCPSRESGLRVVADLVQSLSQQSPIVTASDGASARMVVNACGYTDAPLAPPSLPPGRAR